MDSIPASHLKQNFGEVLARAANGPLGVRRHGKLVAGIVPPQWLERPAAADERAEARAAQGRIETQRLTAHLRLGLELVCGAPRRRRSLIAAALREVDRWQARKLCSADYIVRWRKWLGLPVQQLALRMCSDAAGWGPAMRQNSPFGALAGSATANTRRAAKAARGRTRSASGEP